jgi:hypothetical protein
MHVTLEFTRMRGEYEQKKRTPRSSKCRVAEVSQKPWNPARQFRDEWALFFSAQLLTMRVVRIFCKHVWDQ